MFIVLNISLITETWIIRFSLFLKKALRTIMFESWDIRWPFTNSFETIIVILDQMTLSENHSFINIRFFQFLRSRTRKNRPMWRCLVLTSGSNKDLVLTLTDWVISIVQWSLSYFIIKSDINFLMVNLLMRIRSNKILCYKMHVSLCWEANFTFVFYRTEPANFSRITLFSQNDEIVFTIAATDGVLAFLQNDASWDFCEEIKVEFLSRNTNMVSNESRRVRVAPRFFEEASCPPQNTSDRNKKNWSCIFPEGFKLGVFSPIFPTGDIGDVSRLWLNSYFHLVSKNAKSPCVTASICFWKKALTPLDNILPIEASTALTELCWTLFHIF